MAALLSPGLSITVTDESAYLPTAVGTIPFILFATSQDKTINNTFATGTRKVNAGKVYGISSQRELVSMFGTPTFRQTAAGTPIHGDELNEYGLMTAYSSLGLGNRVWAMRADIDLDQLVGTTVRPKGEVPDGTNWFDVDDTSWGIYEYDQILDTYTNKQPLLITAQSDITLENNIPVPNSNIGAVGSYAVVVWDANNPVFYKNLDNIWVQVGSQEWVKSHPTVIGEANSISTTAESKFSINGVEITIPDNTTAIADVVDLINAANLTGVEAKELNGALALYIDKTSQSDGSSDDGAIQLVDLNESPLQMSLGISPGKHYCPALYFAGYTQIPAWNSADAIPRPTGSVWLKTSVSGLGTNFVIRQYNSTTKAWNPVATPVYADGYAALLGLDPNAGGSGIVAGAVFVKYDTNNTGALSFRFYQLTSGGKTVVVGNSVSGSFVNGSTFDMLVSQPGMRSPETYNITMTGTTAKSFVSDILAANIENIDAKVENSGLISITHRSGGLITLVNTSSGTNPVSIAGFTSSTPGVVSNLVPGAITLTNWSTVRYTYSKQEPYTAPDDGTLWYYSDPTQVDIMICDTTGWKGYKNVSRDVRGYNLQLTDPKGVIVSASQPATQSDLTELVPGDLWLDTSDLENYPRIYRYNNLGKWALIDNTDRISQNGIAFADVRWDIDGTSNPITGQYPDIAALQNSNYVDLDAPDYRLYPRGTLLFNLRRGGYNIKKFVSNYFNAQAYPNQSLPSMTDAWVTESGLRGDGTPYAGHHAQRSLVVQALKAALDSSSDIREETYNFNLLLCPGYHELVPNLIGLNNDRSNTGFIIGDTPMTLSSTINSITEYNTFTAINRDPYLALYYPSALTNDLGGNEIAVPASHIMLRTYIRSDNVSYQWFAPAGTRRGLVDNANAIGYVDANSGLFIKTGINQQMRDALYELNINPITSLNGVGLVVYGQKTRNPISSSMDRVNVARLVNYIRVVLQALTNQFLFEPNDKTTRDQVKLVVESALNDLIVKRGIYDYLVVCDSSNNTSDRISRNELYVDIAIEPMRAVEFIYIPIRLKNPGTIKGVK